MEFFDLFKKKTDNTAEQVASPVAEPTQEAQPEAQQAPSAEAVRCR